MELPVVEGRTAMRLIDADAFVAKLDHVPMVQEAIRKAMDTMPTIEQPEIIRCKDCGKQPVCRFSQFQGNDGYCGLAERKGER